MTIIESIRNYLLTCTLLGNSKINIDYLPEHAIEYSVDTTPAEQIVTRYVRGATERQYLFVVRSVNEYGSDVLQNLENSGFFESLSTWFETQTKAKTFPTLPTGMKCDKIEAQSTAYLFSTQPDTAKYQIQCRITYYQEA